MGETPFIAFLSEAKLSVVNMLYPSFLLKFSLQPNVLIASFTALLVVCVVLLKYWGSSASGANDL